MKRIVFVFITLSLVSISGPDGRAVTHNDAIFISHNLPPYMVAGHTYNVSVTLQNAGHTIWDSWRPSGGNYHFGHIQGSWRGSRIEMPYRVLPGERVTLSFTVTAPGCCSDAPFQFQMVEENREWFGQATPLVHIPIYSHAERDSAFVSQEVPTVMIAGYGYRARITMRNTGSGSWGQAGRRLGSNVPGSGRPAIGPGRVDDFVVDADDPNLVTFTVPIVAPPTPGAYDFQYQMLEENVTWFGSFTPNVTVTVVPPPGPSTGAVAVLSADAAFTPASAPGDVALKAAELWLLHGCRSVARVGSRNSASRTQPASCLRCGVGLFEQ